MVTAPIQQRLPHQIQCSQIEQQAMNAELHKMADTTGIELAPPHVDNFVSTHFLVPKSGDRWRLVFNLKPLNQFVEKAHFKMESLSVLPDLVSEGAWMAKLDLRDAFHSIPIHQRSRRFLCFHWAGHQWRYTCLPFGLSESPRAFTKILRPVAAWLRAMGIVLIVYLDDWLLIGSTPELVASQVEFVATSLERLGFQINREKSQFQPQQVLVFLGVEINLCKMMYYLPAEKLAKIRAECRRLLGKKSASLAELRSLIGKMVATRPAISFAVLHTRGLQFCLNTLLAREGHSTQLDDWACADMQWWIHQSPASNGLPIHRPQPAITMSSDASNLGWGAATATGQASGPWTPEEDVYHINWKEMKAVWLGLKSLLRQARSTVIRLEVDNTTTVAYLNHQGGTHSRSLCLLSIQVLEWAAERDIVLEAVHVPGLNNQTADYLSRHVEETGDWMLPDRLFQQLARHFLPLSRDLFAARHNARLPQYVSWKPDPEAEAVDAFTISPSLWDSAYAFPPFSLVGRCLQFVQRHSVPRVVLIAPMWQAQSFYPKLLQMSSDFPTLLPSSAVVDPWGQVHPQAEHLRLVVWTISGRSQQCEAFRRTLSSSGCLRGETVPMPATNQPGSSGYAGVVDRAFIPLQPLMR